MDDEACFDIEIEDLDGWVEEDGWSDCKYWMMRWKN